MTDDERLKSINHAMQEVYSRAKLEEGYDSTCLDWSRHDRRATPATALAIRVRPQAPRGRRESSPSTTPGERPGSL